MDLGCEVLGIVGPSLLIVVQSYQQEDHRFGLDHLPPLPSQKAFGVCMSSKTGEYGSNHAKFKGIIPFSTFAQSGIDVPNPWLYLSALHFYAHRRDGDTFRLSSESRKVRNLLCEWFDRAQLTAFLISFLPLFCCESLAVLSTFKCLFVSCPRNFCVDMSTLRTKYGHNDK